jgi:hypothetical protein
MSIDVVPLWWRDWWHWTFLRRKIMKRMRRMIGLGPTNTLTTLKNKKF